MERLKFILATGALYQQKGGLLQDFKGGPLATGWWIGGPVCHWVRRTMIEASGKNSDKANALNKMEETNKKKKKY